MNEQRPDFSKISTVEELEKLVEHLRSDRGCPWDRKQTARSLKPYLLEEVYELMEAIEADDPARLRDELGDVLLHLCFQVSLAREAGKLDLAGVVAAVRDKMIRRHPHVFGQAVFESHADQLFAWEQIKKREKSKGSAEAARPEEASVLDGLPGKLPPLSKSYRIQGRVSHYRFDWDNPGELFAKVEEELRELRSSLDAGDQDAQEEEVGDLLFTVVNLARLLGVHPRLALERTNSKFIHRFRQLERIVRERGLVLGELTLEELDNIWEEVKKTETGTG
ncbi:MAG: nucleoside triphosphate pyrophosphohydrolase [Candidatus Glassbacteria bacterium]|nr:nucleoside triphosphate pyrophosphohydrolase [Candidatus Glassbacteria bacterium]